MLKCILVYSSLYKHIITKKDMQKDYKRGDGNLPVLHVSGKGIAKAWEDSVVELDTKGLWYHRQGDKDKGRVQLDANMKIVIESPLSEPFYHKQMTCQPSDLFAYQMEMLGAKNSWIDPTGKSERWPYGYNERLSAHPGAKRNVNQLEKMINQLSSAHHKRNINAVTWVPERDFELDDPPCLQRVQFIAVPDEISGDGSLVLNMDYDFRSRNVMIAAPMNMLGLATLQAYIAKEVKKKSGKKIKLGRVTDDSNSYHVTANNVGLLKKFKERLKVSLERGETIEDRCYDQATTLEMMEEEKPKVVSQIIEQTRQYLFGKKLDKEIEKIEQIAETVSEINKIS